MALINDFNNYLRMLLKHPSSTYWARELGEVYSKVLPKLPNPTELWFKLARRNIWLYPVSPTQWQEAVPQDFAGFVLVPYKHPFQVSEEQDF
jgi:hypothetical protein